MGLIAWIIFGALAGWVASIVVGNNARQGCLMNIIVGVIGALIGGFMMQLITGSRFTFDFTLPSFVIAVIGAILLLVITGAGRRR
ncbi:MAG: GlsB/YeaQ/YmgE family stress response membrane protein [Candidatus Roseilinea sp.]|uniref:GlsB/YeaQ/YmgE family stress response membrane protein n=1 Tax=Candidatus Roseilinea sp. TaxID=2838777 RepID=UPI00404B3B7C